MHNSLDEHRVEFCPAVPATPGPPQVAESRDDASIRAEILDAIAHAAWLELGGIAVTVNHGEVLLDGEISERRLRPALREIAGRCCGVRAVYDRLRVTRRSGSV